jgi:hypothetical protein
MPPICVSGMTFKHRSSRISPKPLAIALEPARRPPNVRGTTFDVAVVPLVRRKSTVSLVPFQSGPTSGLLLEFISDDPLVEA